MNRLNHKRHTQHQRVRRVRAVIRGTAARPRLSVNISLRQVTAQLIDDTNGITLAAGSSLQAGSKTNTMSQKAALVGQIIADKAKSVKIEQAVFDRGRRRYHGRVKMLCDAARNNGLKI